MKIKYKSKKKFIFLLFIMGISFPSLSAETYKIQKIGIEQGLSNNYIVSITQDTEGFLWFATESGLNRFDGNTFTVFKKDFSSDNSINSNELNRILADPYNKIIWIATQRTGLNAYDYTSHSFYHYTPHPNNPEGIISPGVTDLSFAVDGNLWLSTYDSGVDYFNKKTKKFTHYNSKTIPGMVSNMIWSLTDDQKGNLYIGHVNNGLSILSLKTRKIKNYVHDASDPYSIPSNTVKSIYIDKKGNVWIGTSNGLALFNPITEVFTLIQGTFSSASSLNTILSIKGLKDGRLLIGTENDGVKILEFQQPYLNKKLNVSLENIPAKDDESGLSAPSVTSVFQDSYGNIWMGTYGGGINFMSNKPDFFQTWSYSSIRGTEKNSPSSRTAWGICADDNGRLWIGTEGGGIDVFENGTKIKNYKSGADGLQSNIIYAALKDSEGNLWFGTHNGTVCYNAKTRQFCKLSGVLDKSMVRCLYEDNAKNIWIGTMDGVCAYNIRTKKYYIYNINNSKLPDNIVRGICQDSKGNIWVGTLSLGMAVFTKQFELLHLFNKNNGFCSNGITFIYRDSKNRMWVATRDGLVRFNSCSDTSYKVYHVKDGLANSYIRAITEGQNNEIWASTNGGISCLKLDKGQCINYDYNDGLPIGVFKDGSVVKISNGTVYFGSQNGVCFFNPGKELSKVYIPQPVITEFKIYEKNTSPQSNEISIPVSKSIKLLYDQSTFSISFNIPDYALNRKTEFTYSLKGLDNTWYRLKNEKQVTFRNIPHGKYVFIIKARIRNQQWSDKYTSLNIIIKPPYWLTWWAKAIYVILVISVIFSIILFYKNKIYLENELLWEKRSHQQEHELNNEKLNFYTNIAHELRTPLTLILGPLEDLSQDRELSQVNSKKVSLIYRSAQRLLELINQVLEFRKTETYNRKLRLSLSNISGLVMEIGMKYKELNQNQRITININIESPVLMLYFDPEIITIILDNLISNAIKNTEKGEIVLALRNTIKEDKQYTEIEVRDTGHGISADTLPKIFDSFYQVKDDRQISGSGIGLALVKNLVSLHQATITVNSAIGKGSSFCFQLPIDNTYPDSLYVENSVESLWEEKSADVDKMADTDKALILIVEDNRDIREYVANSFTGSYEIIIAENGAVGLEMAIAHTPDIIITDIMMPVMDGLELCGKLKDDIRTSHIPVILLTAKDSLYDKSEGYAYGADSYITKPFSTILIKNRVTNLLNARRKMAELFANNLGQKRAQITESISKLDNEFIEKLTAIIEENLDSEKVNVIAIADQMMMSYSSLYRKIKALTGLPANEFIRKIKIKNAERLLLTGKYSISEVAFKIGINSVKYFRQCFKEEYGTTPSEYINNLKNK